MKFYMILLHVLFSLSLNSFILQEVHLDYKTHPFLPQSWYFKELSHEDLSLCVRLKSISMLMVEISEN